MWLRFWQVDESGWNWLFSFLDQICYSFTNHHNGNVRVCPYAIRHDRSICDPQAIHPVHHPELVNDSHFIIMWSHSCGAGNMMSGCNVASHPCVEIVVRFKIGVQWALTTLVKCFLTEGVLPNPQAFGFHLARVYDPLPLRDSYSRCRAELDNPVN